MASGRWNKQGIVALVRPWQWSKNFLVLAALLFSRKYLETWAVWAGLRMFVGFCLCASGLYVFNDLLDVESDRRHPRRRLRPLASGAVSLELAWILAPVLAAAGLFLTRGEPAGARILLGSYVLVGVLYSAWLKRVVIVDVLVVASGFVLRAAAGAMAIMVPISPWLLACAGLLALFLALAKRRHELRLSGAKGRAVLSMYSAGLLDQMTAVVTSCTLMAYILYSFSEQTVAKFPSGLMPVSTVFVLFGIFRYLYLVYRKDAGGEPEAILVTDRPMQVTILLYLASVWLAVR